MALSFTRRVREGFTPLSDGLEKVVGTDGEVRYDEISARLMMHARDSRVAGRKPHQTIAGLQILGNQEIRGAHPDLAKLNPRQEADIFDTAIERVPSLSQKASATIVSSELRQAVDSSRFFLELGLKPEDEIKFDEERVKIIDVVEEETGVYGAWAGIVPEQPDEPCEVPDFRVQVTSVSFSSLAKYEKHKDAIDAFIEEKGELEITFGAINSIDLHRRAQPSQHQW